jgi:hypothetical protein
MYSIKSFFLAWVRFEALCTRITRNLSKCKIPCVVGWFFGAKHFGHFVRSFLFLIDEAIKTTG